MLSQEETKRQENALKQGGFKYLEERKEIPIMWEGRTEKVIIKKLSNREMSFCRRRSNKSRLVGREIVMETDQETFKDLVIQQGVVSSPFGNFTQPDKYIDLNVIGNLEQSFANAIATEIMSYNKLTDEKKED
jgi:hypothetical protein